MGNPHPTGSKPIKIGRKHTGAPSIRQKGKATAKTRKTEVIRVATMRRFKQRVAAYFRGETDRFPAKPV